MFPPASLRVNGLVFSPLDQDGEMEIGPNSPSLGR
jgi:hypothetical protein